MSNADAHPDQAFDVMVYGIVDQHPQTGAPRDRFHVYLGLDRVRTYGTEAAAIDGARQLAREKGRAAWVQGPADDTVRPIELADR